MLESRFDFSRLMKKAPLAGAFFMSAIWLSSAHALCPAPASQLEAVSVQRVVDGDTVRLSDGRNVRMIGLNTPELGKKGRSDEPFAAAARKRLQALVAASDGRLGLLAGQEGKDRYGRTLAHLYSANGDNLEAQMLAEGLGYLVAVAPNVDFVSCQQAAETHCAAGQAGVVAAVTCAENGADQPIGFCAAQRTCEQGSAQSWRNLDRVAGFGCIARCTQSVRSIRYGGSGAAQRQADRGAWLGDRSLTARWSGFRSSALVIAIDPSGHAASCTVKRNCRHFLS